MSENRLQDIIYKLRIKNSFSLQEAADRINIDQKLLSKIESGEVQPDDEIINKLIRIYGEDLSSYLGINNGIPIINSDISQLEEHELVYKIQPTTENKILINKVADLISKFKSVKRAWLFGSFARKEDEIDSDIDLLIDVPANEVFTLFDLAEIKEQLEFGCKRKFDVVLLSGLRPQIRKRVEKDLKLIYEAR